MGKFGDLVKVEEVECIGFSAYKISNGCIEVVIVPELGGRIMGFGYIDNNIIYQNAAYYQKKALVLGEKSNEIKKQREEIGWLIYGGGKTWVAPQEDWDGPPYLDLDSGTYQVEIDTKSQADVIIIALKSPVCRETKLRIIKTIKIPSTGSKISISQRLENHSSEAINKGIWQVTMLKRPAIVSFPCTGSSKFEKGIKTFDSNFEQERLVKIKDGQANISCEDTTGFKFGTDINKGYVDTAIVGTNMVFKKEFEANDGPYGHECAIEVYNDPAEVAYLEVEVHGPLQRINPGEYSEYTVYWSMNRH